VDFPIYPYRVRRGEYRNSLHPIEKSQRAYRSPLLLALGYKETLESGKYRNQTDLAKTLNYTPSRINRLLNLPESLQRDILQGRIRPSERRLRGILSRKTPLPGM